MSTYFVFLYIISTSWYTYASPSPLYFRRHVKEDNATTIPITEIETKEVLIEVQNAIEEEMSENEDEEGTATVSKEGGESCQGNSDHPDYTNMATLEKDGSVIFYYKIIGTTSLSAQLIYRGKGYVSWANAPTGMMVYSEAIIGLPDKPLSSTNPGKYAIKSYSGVNLMSSQTLINSNIIQNDTTTTLTFTKLLNEDGEIPIDPNGINTFTWAVGSSNGLGYHIKRSSYKIDLSKTCSGEPQDFVISLTQKPASLAYWKAHGILAGLSWAVFTPIAIMASWYRELSQGAMWMKLHIYLNVLCSLCTTISFIVAFIAISKSGSGKQHFNAPHQKLGLAMFILVIFQTVGGYMRPSKNVIKVEGYSKRRFWELTHKFVGYFLFIASIWEVQEGLKLYEVRSGGKDVTMIYWGWLIALFIVNFLFCAYIYLYKRKLRRELVM